ncbi:YihY/virulence factor BrkB family protein [Pseudomonas sp. MYb185]|uniref:YihY/virulence factor BrkB family protein n=1 Tax=Pseudomonas sp. MYb185 TaxID=1848729 RepID=UPI000CFBA363|nr:YihY/virulence factor BrkB family protein [Pseudomonas sp. MYb185]PRB83892.1 ribonuclease BN [Pseudomonas sp. MYb185]
MSFLKLRNAGVVSIVKRTARGFSEHDMSTYAAALAYRALFSIFPFILFLMAVLGFLHLPDFFDWLREQAALVLPPIALDQVNPVIDQLQRSQGGLLSFGILLALWTASIGVRSLMNAMNKAYAVQEGRPGWKLFILSILYTIGIAVMLLLAAGFMTLGPQVMTWLAAQIGLEQVLVVIWAWLRWPVAILLLMLAVALIYYATPDVEQEFRFITPGSVVAVIVWLVASIGFGIYVQNFANYNATYGSIGAIIVLLLYFYISAAVLLLGGELNAAIEHASTEGKEPGEKVVDQ